MLLTITTSHTPATDIGFLFEKHPDSSFYRVFLKCSVSWGRNERT
jgi:hypothetical protein